MNAFSDGFFSAISARHRSVIAADVISPARSARARSVIVRGWPDLGSAGIRVLHALLLSGGIVVPVGRTQGGGGAREGLEHRPERRETPALSVLYRVVEPTFDRHSRVRKSAIRNPQSAIGNRQSANPQIRKSANPQFAIRNPQSAIRNPQFAL
jgi:hypothetical protein